MPDFIPLTECEDRRLYRIRSRNLTVGAFSAKTKGFIGLRHKFGTLYLFEEYHRDTGAPHGTADPLEALDVLVPEHVPLAERLPGSVCTEHDRPCEFRGGERGAVPRRGAWHHLDDDTELVGRDNPAARPNEELTHLVAAHTDLTRYPGYPESLLELYGRPGRLHGDQGRVVGNLNTPVPRVSQRESLAIATQLLAAGTLDTTARAAEILDRLTLIAPPGTWCMVSRYYASPVGEPDRHDGPVIWSVHADREDAERWTVAYNEFFEAQAVRHGWASRRRFTVEQRDDAPVRQLRRSDVDPVQLVKEVHQ